MLHLEPSAILLNCIKRLLKTNFCLFVSGWFTPVLLYKHLVRLTVQKISHLIFFCIFYSKQVCTGKTRFAQCIKAYMGDFFQVLTATICQKHHSFIILKCLHYVGIVLD